MRVKSILVFCLFNLIVTTCFGSDGLCANIGGWCGHSSENHANCGEGQTLLVKICALLDRMTAMEDKFSVNSDKIGGNSAADGLCSNIGGWCGHATDSHVNCGEGQALLSRLCDLDRRLTVVENKFKIASSSDTSLCANVSGWCGHATNKYVNCGEGQVLLKKICNLQKRMDDIEKATLCECLDFNDNVLTSLAADTMNDCWASCCNDAKCHAAKLGKYPKNC